MRTPTLAIAALAALACAATAQGAVIKTGAFGADTSFFDTASVPLGPGTYRFTLRLSTPVIGLSGYAEKQTATDEYCDFQDGAGEVPCGGDDVPTQSPFAAVTPRLYRATLGVDPLSTALLSPPFTRAENTESCCGLQFEFATAGAGTYALSYAAVPEPASWALMILGTGCVGAGLRRRTARAGFA